ncbi:MAG TPA: 30S ribosome-binding factor RbfA [Firmicutes bacterium]|jgi:ribosome-binding factor A|nr:MAG: ribosome-binding factor A [Peptococcaceae bacterium 1109]HHT72504.1 30S ribosome-binding factor RbfA [Bacillota bacterium]
MSNKHSRITEDIKRAVSDIISRQVKDPRLGMVSITDVDLSRDFSVAKIFFSVLGDEQAIQDSLAGLNNAKGFIRTELARRVRMRHTPEIVFVYDESLERGARINAILRELNVAPESDGGEDL